MAIGRSKLHALVNRRRLLSESVIWFNSFDVELKNYAINLIRKDQLTDQGIDADGDVIGYYSLVTSFINPIKKFNTHYTLDNTGEFYKSIFIRVLSDRVLAEANSKTFNEMVKQEWYSDRILNWTHGNIGNIKEQLKTRYIKAVRKALLTDR